METAAILVGVFSPGAMHLFFKVGAILADEGALHALCACKGAGGLKPCLMCANVYNASNPRMIPERDPTGVAVPHTCADSAKLVPLTRPVLSAIFKALAATAAMPKSKGRLEEQETQLGWSHVPGSLLSRCTSFGEGSSCERVHV